MLRTIRIPNMSALEVKNGNSELVKFYISSSGSIEFPKKSEKSKGQNLSKSQKLAKLEKNLSKSENLSYFNTKENGPSFSILKARIAFNCL